MKKGFQYKKAVQALNLFAKKENGVINKMKAVKLIWLSDRLHLRKYGRTIFSDVYWAVKNGPMPSATTDLAEEKTEYSDPKEFDYRDQFLKIVDDYNFQSISNFNEKVFSKTELEVLENIYNYFGQFDQWELSDISHKYSEWKKYEDMFDQNTESNRYLIEVSDFFNDSDEDDLIFKETQKFKDLSKEIFEEEQHIASILN